MKNSPEIEAERKNKWDKRRNVLSISSKSMTSDQLDIKQQAKNFA